MLVLGLNGSPRKKGNSEYLLTQFLRQAEKRGFETRVVNCGAHEYQPCIGCGSCEKKGVCFHKDALADEVFSLFRRADVLVLSGPVYFYSFPSQIKAIIDRTQTLWSRKYRFGLGDPGEGQRKGVLLCCGATRGENLFDGIKLTARYFFDAAGAEFTDHLWYRRVDERGEIQKMPGVKGDITELGDRVLTSLEGKLRICFVCTENAGRSQMAAGFARHMAGKDLDVASAGSQPADSINNTVVEAMAEKKLDIAFLKPRKIQSVLNTFTPQVMVTMGCSDACPVVPGAKVVNWDLPDPKDSSLAEVRKIRDEIEKKVSLLCRELTNNSL
ncbi:MAG: NAD(P)H-dependent oxidoreductase [Desulfobacteraceae bacterium]